MEGVSMVLLEVRTRPWDHGPGRGDDESISGYMIRIVTIINYYSQFKAAIEMRIS